MIVNLTLESDGPAENLSFEFERMFNAGYTGRNQKEVRKHIQELAAKGIPGPAVTPTLYPVVCQSLIAGGEVDVYGSETSGEAEYVLLVQDESKIFVALGSDHTDRMLEKTDIPRAKQICPNLISTTAWRLDDLKDHWDELVLRSSVVRGGQDVPYQEGPLAQLLAPDQLLEFVRDTARCPLSGTIIFSGTLSLKTGDFTYGEGFRAELVDRRLGRTLKLAYNIRSLEPLSV